jgi:hypothetical protein
MRAIQLAADSTLQGCKFRRHDLTSRGQRGCENIRPAGLERVSITARFDYIESETRSGLFGDRIFCGKPVSTFPENALNHAYLRS